MLRVMLAVWKSLARSFLAANIAAGMASGAPPHYRIIWNQWVDGPSCVLADGDVVFGADGAVKRWSGGETTPIVKSGQRVDGARIQLVADWGIGWGAAKDGDVFAPCWIDRTPVGRSVGLLACLPRRTPALWLETGDDLPGGGKMRGLVPFGLAPSDAGRTFIHVLQSRETEPEGEMQEALLVLTADASARGRRVDVLFRTGDPAPGGSDRFSPSFSSWSMCAPFADEQGQCMILAHVRSEPVYMDLDGRDTLWRWSEARGLERLLDPNVQNVDGWAATPIYNASMTRGGVFAIVATLSKPGVTSRNAILVFDAFDAQTTRIAAIEGETTDQGTIGRICRVGVNESGSIAFGAQLTPRGQTTLDERLFVYHRRRQGTTKLVYAPNECAFPAPCRFAVPLWQAPECLDDDRVYFNGEEFDWNWHAWGLYAFDAGDAGDRVPRRVLHETQWPSRGYPVVLGGGSDSGAPMRLSNGAGRVVVASDIGIAIVDSRLAACTCDLTCDGVVDWQDFFWFFWQYDIMDCADNAMVDWCDADFDRDGLVDDGDFAIFASVFGEGACPSIE